MCKEEYTVDHCPEAGNAALVLNLSQKQGMCRSIPAWLVWYIQCLSWSTDQIHQVWWPLSQVLSSQLSATSACNATCHVFMTSDHILPKHDCWSPANIAINISWTFQTWMLSSYIVRSISGGELGPKSPLFSMKISMSHSTMYWIFRKQHLESNINISF